MKIIRILTGAHAGIEARLAPGQYRIGNGQDTDICITDWEDTEVTIELDEAGTISVRKDRVQAGSASAPDDPSVILIPDLTPFPFGKTVVCFGSADVPWPPDIDLLANLYTSGKHAPFGADSPSGARRTIRIALLCAICAVLATAGVLLFNTQPSYAANTPTNPVGIPELAQQVETALHAAKLTELNAMAHGGTVVINGMVADSSEDISARTVFAHFSDRHIARQYDVAQTDVANLEDSLGIDGVHVSYQGKGMFSVTGTVPSMAEFNDALNRVRADLDNNIKHIDIGVTEAPSTTSMSTYSEMIAVSDMRYVQTSDGVKHLFPITSAAAGHVSTHHAIPSP